MALSGYQSSDGNHHVYGVTSAGHLLHWELAGTYPPGADKWSVVDATAQVAKDNNGATFTIEP